MHDEELETFPELPWPDHDSRRNCWITRPAHAVNLDDNTLLVVTGSKAVRLSGKDLSPVGAVQGIRIIDIRE
jgi:hypothetical protein